MSRMIKELLEKEFRNKYADLESGLVVSVHGLNGTDVNNFRAELKKSSAEVHVIQNRLARRALTGTTLEPLGAMLAGPCALVTGGPSPIDIAKELVRLTKDYPKLELKYGLIEGEAETAPIEEISKRKSKSELQGDIVLLALSPGRRIAGCLNVGGVIAGCIKAVAEKLEKGETIAKVA